MKSNRRVPPVWLMGLSNTTLGLTNGTVFFVMPQLLAAEHVPESKIAAITAVAMSANFWAVIFSPMLDVRFSRRWHSTFFVVLTSVLLFLAIVNLHHLLLLEVVLDVGRRGGRPFCLGARRMAFDNLFPRPPEQTKRLDEYCAHLWHRYRFSHRR